MIVVPACQLVLFAALMLVCAVVVFVAISRHRSRARSAAAKRIPLFISDGDEWYV